MRQAPAGVNSVGRQLAVRAGLIRPVGDVSFARLPLGLRVVRRAEDLARAALDCLGGQELRLPILYPEGGGCRGMGGSRPLRLSDPQDRSYELPASYAATVAGLAASTLHSYRDLPSLVYLLQPRFRASRPRDGLLRGYETHALEAFSFHPDGEERDRFYGQVLDAIHHLLGRCDVDAVRAEAGREERAHVFLLPHAGGEETLARCPSCGYAASGEWGAVSLPEGGEPSQEMRPVDTPDCATIAAVADCVGVPTHQTLKAVFTSWERSGRPPELVFVVIRGDLEVSEAKLQGVLGEGKLQPATDEQISAAGAEPGYASPVGLDVRSSREGEGVLVVGDRSLLAGADFVVGANRPHTHLTGVNYPRDFAVTLLVDVAQVQPGHPCPHCGDPLSLEPAVRLGYGFKGSAGCPQLEQITYQDAQGQERPALPAGYGLEIEPLLLAVIETHHDEWGILWPPALSPFDVHLVALAPPGEERARADGVYERLLAAGLEVLYDDRNERAGVKFADADLIGCPLRITVSRRSWEAGGVELKLRGEEERRILPLEELTRLSDFLDSSPGL
jgi:prolyl-tRNA synthetase